MNVAVLNVEYRRVKWPQPAGCFLQFSPKRIKGCPRVGLEPMQYDDDTAMALFDKEDCSLLPPTECHMRRKVKHLEQLGGRTCIENLLHVSAKGFRLMYRDVIRHSLCEHLE